MRIAKTGCLLLFTLIFVNGCTAPPPDEVSTPTAPQITPAGPEVTSTEPFITTDSGLKYRILREGDGEAPTPADTVLCHYRGWLDDGTQFDSSYGREPFRCSPGGGIIDGWKEGLQLVHEGGMIELEIPYDLGYGEDGYSTIPPYATLHFTMELIEIL